MRLLFLGVAFLSFFAATAQPRFTDSTFGTNGKVVENTSIPDVHMVDALLQPDGKSLILAYTDYNTRPLTIDNYETITRAVLIRYNTNGTPDASFSNDGVADSLIVPDAACQPTAMRLQPDGKILVCGTVGVFTNNQKAFAMRYNADGSLDVSFADSGILYLPSFTLATTFNLSTIEDVVVLPDGKITLLSNRTYFYQDVALVRLNSNGSIDSSFGTNGIITTNPQSSLNSNQQYFRLEVLASGKYIVGGTPNTNSPSGVSYKYIVARINANGTLDSTYGTKGSIRLTDGLTSDELEDIVVQPDGKVVVNGLETAYASNTYNCVFRINANGTADATFGSGGKRIISYYTNGLGAVQSHLGLQADGKILVSGVGKNSDGNYTMAVARLTTAGALDANFDGDGVALLQVNGYSSYGYIPLPQNDGKIAIAGFACNGNFTSVAIGRFTATGQTDGSLNAAATIILLNNGISYDGGNNVLIQPADQKIVSIRERDNGYYYDLCVSRHLPNGLPDNSFGTNGKTYINMPGYTYFNMYSEFSTDGKLTIVPAYFDNVSAGNLAVFRLKANGQPDSSFGLYGKKIFKSRNTDTIYTSLDYASVQPDGKVLIVAHQYEGAIEKPNRPDSSFLIRLNTDGSFDNSFGIAGRKWIAIGGGVDAVAALQPDGKILFTTGSYIAAGTFRTTVMRLNTNGSTDVTFNNGQDKILNTPISQIVVQPNGKIVLGSARKSVIRLLNNGNYDSTFGTAGVFDITGYYASDLNSYDQDFAVAADSSRIMLKINLQDSVAPYDAYLKIIALKNNGSPDSTFGQAGVVVPDFSPYGYGRGIALQADQKIVLVGGGYTNYDALVSGCMLTRLKSTNVTLTGRRYTFTGSGLWSNGANWADGTVPPTTIPAGSSIIIDPPTGSECVIDIPVQVQAGATVTVKAGKKVRLPGNLIIQ